MSANSLTKRIERTPHPESPRRRLLLTLALPLWVFGAYMFAQLLIAGLIQLLILTGVDFSTANLSVLNASLGATVYTLSIALIIGLPWLILRRRTSSQELGLHRLPTWLDIVITPAAFIVYLVISAIILALAQSFLTFIDFDQVQNVGFDGLTQQYEYILAFVTLVIVAPVAEEVLFRGYLLSKLRKHAATWIAILITSVLFAIVHFAWNVGLDVFALSIVLCLVTIWTKSLWPAILIHMLKNGIAFYFLFINPTLLNTLGG